MSCYSWSVLGKQLCKSCTSGKKENIYTYYLEERGVIWNTYTDYTVILNIYADYLEGGYLEYLCRLSGGGDNLEYLCRLSGEGDNLEYLQRSSGGGLWGVGGNLVKCYMI